MKIGIIGAMEEEIRYLKQVVTNQEVHSQFSFDFIKGNLGEHEVIIVQSGIGKVNATICVVLLKQLYNVDVIINTGSAGGVDPALQVGDVVIAHSLIHHDVDVTGFDYALGQMAGMPELYYPETQLVRLAQDVCRQLDIEPVIGQIASGDQFVNDSASIQRIRTAFPTVRAVEMESAAIAQAAYVMGIPFVIIRAISDSADEVAGITFDQFITLAGKQSASIVTLLVEAIPIDKDDWDSSAKVL